MGVGSSFFTEVQNELWQDKFYINENRCIKSKQSTYHLRTPDEYCTLIRGSLFGLKMRSQAAAYGHEPEMY